jgi:hypothetical protein
MTDIDWTKPVETDEDPPRPVRVLCTDFKAKGFPTMCAVDYGDYEMHALFSNEGWDTQKVMRLRNVAPKPEPVLLEAWVNCYAPDNIIGHATREEADRKGRPEARKACLRVAWMSDGSPVPGEMDPVRLSLDNIKTDGNGD